MDSKKVNQARELFAQFGRLDADRDAVIRAFLSLAGDNVTFEEWNQFRTEFGVQYCEKHQKANADAINKAWSRFVACCATYATEQGFDFEVPAKPKSTSEAATKKAAQRAIPESVATATTTAELDAIVRPSDAVAAAKLEASIASKKLSLAKAEATKQEKTVKDALKARRDLLISFVRKADAAQLAELEAMRDHQVAVILAALPLPDVQSTTAKLIECANADAARVAKLNAAIDAAKPPKAKAPKAKAKA